MNFQYSKFISLALSAALLFTGCSAQQAASTAAESSDTELSQPVNSLDAAETAVTQAEESATSDAYAEAFSNRDLSGEYDLGESIPIQLNGSSASCNASGVSIVGSTVTITAAGVYLLSGTLDNGSVIVDVNKEDKVQLVLSGATINSNTFAAIYVKQADKVFITLADGTVNRLSNGGAFVQIDDNDVDAVIFAKDDVTLNGTGTLQISSSAGHGIVGKDEVTITGGVYEIAAANHAIRAKDSLSVADGSFTLTAGKDGLHAENSDDEMLGNIYIAGGDFIINVPDDAIHANTLLQIDGGSFDLTAAEGLEATYVQINDGTINISASDDGVNAARKSSAYTPTVEINGGTLTIVMGAGDTDGVDSNGDIIINGGTIDVTGQSAFDYDGTAQYNGGTLIVNGQQVSTIPNQMMGGGMHGGMGGGMHGGMRGDMGGGMHGGMPGGMQGGSPDDIPVGDMGSEMRG